MSRALRAIFVREFTGAFGQPLAFVVLALFLALFAVATLIFDDLLGSGVATMSRPFLWAAGALLLLVPAVTMRSISEERRSGSIELLLTFPVSAADVVVGKWLAAVAIVASALVLTLPWPIALAWYGELDWGPVAGGYLGLLLVGASYAAVGVAASALAESQVVAFLAALFACLVPWLLWWGLGFVPGPLVPLAEHVTFGWHFANLARGVLDTRSVVFCASVIVCGLWLAARSLDHRRLA